MKILSIVGARPQFIKAFALSRELRRKHTEILVHTGQHYDYEMSKIFFDELDIPKPDYNLEVGSGPHGEQTGKILEKLEKVILSEKPDLVLVYGDTNSTLAGALAAVKLHVKVAHVEAGLRSFDRRMPEEINRIVTDHVSDILLAPTKTAMAHLKSEGIAKNAHLVGDVMQDAMEIARERAKKSKIISKLRIEGKYVLATLHRAENTDDRGRLSNIVDAFLESGANIVLPLHPRTRKVLENSGLMKKIDGKNIKIVDPVGYVDMIALMDGAEKILTDSGGVQKEAYMLGRPCITMRDNTEWVETVDAGWNVLVGAEKKKIMEAIKNFNPKGSRKDIFGGGGACGKIVGILEKFEKK
ncbi:MAG: UDP-N-acetylglucosamine 2-epimerase (non-hydrolyzing) [Candidatus Thermoplasmatota archaeon]|nr:UDP-N-acetylglucosamine 2-epimerase (non-hydrolyzing) [Candidatus Thermoplasmatota archaeon]